MRLDSSGLDKRRLAVHQERVQQFGKTSRHFPITATCTVENGGILKIDRSFSGKKPSGFVGFVPAAGAASRYLQPLVPLQNALKRGHRDELHTALADLLAKDADQWALPQAIHNLLLAKKFSTPLKSEDVHASQLLIDMPKALFPCVREGLTFLNMKSMEHQAFQHLEGEVFVCPPGLVGRFKDELNRQQSKSPLAVEVMEQGLNLSTVRMHADGTPVIDELGQPSLVPGGHGTLISLFPQVKNKFPQCHSLLIRNIDNVVGTVDYSVPLNLAFMTFHEFVLQQMQAVRQAFDVDDQSALLSAAKPLLNLLPKSAIRNPLPHAWINQLTDPLLKALCNIQVHLFHTPLDRSATVADLRKLFARPLHTMGQVPNLGKDVGGTPAFVAVDNVLQKLCLEVPHASSADLNKFLKDPTHATHFNPVHVAVELPAKEHPIRDEDHPFWIIAQKQYLGQEVFYQETLLYELLGSSQYANVLFVEIPRTLFNPHKTLADSTGKHLKHWL